MKKLYRVLVGAALAAALVGCGATHDIQSSDNTVTASTPDSKSKNKSDSQNSDSSDSATKKLTETVTWDDGLSVHLSNFQRGVSSSYAAPENTSYVKFTVTVSNGRAKTFDLSDLDVSCTTDSVFDDGLDGTPTTHLLVGETKSWAEACTFGKSDSKFQLEVTPYDFSDDSEYSGYKTAIFAGTIK